MKKFVSFISAFLICAVMTFPVISIADDGKKAGEKNVSQTEDDKISDEE